jgi:predicted nucleotidyltransferase
MLRKESLLFIRATAQEYGARRVLLFGSCLDTPEEKADDIDLAVEGLPRSDYRKFWSKLLWADELKGKSVDVVRIEENGFLVPIILDEGREIYAER